MGSEVLPSPWGGAGGGGTARVATSATGSHASGTHPYPRHCEPPQAARQSMDCACRPAPTQSPSRAVTPWIAASLTLHATTKAGPRVKPAATQGAVPDRFANVARLSIRRGGACCYPLSNAASRQTTHLLTLLSSLVWDHVEKLLPRRKFGARRLQWSAKHRRAPR